MTYKDLRRDIAGMMLAGLVALVSVPAAGHAQVTGDTARQMEQSSGQVATTDDDDDGMDLGWLGLLGLAGLLGLRRRETVDRIDTRPARP